MHLLSIQQILWISEIAGEVLLAGALITRGLARKWPIFLIFLVADAVFGVILIRLAYPSTSYAVAYRLYFVFMAVVKLGVAAELYERFSDHFRGIGNFRFAMAGVLLLTSACLSLGTFRPVLAARWVLPHTVALVVGRHEATILACTLIATRLFLAFFLNARPPLRRNVTVHWMIFTAYLTIEAAAETAVLIDRSVVYVANITALAGQTLCLMLWIRCMTPRGEHLAKVYEWTPEGKARRQEINESLLKLVQDARDELLHRR
jgi:hypothetical protein